MFHISKDSRHRNLPFLQSQTILQCSIVNVEDWTSKKRAFYIWSGVLKLMKRTIILVNGEWEKGLEGKNILVYVYYCYQRVFFVLYEILIFSYLLCLQGLSIWSHNSEAIQLKGCVYKSPNKNVGNILKEF